MSNSTSLRTKEFRQSPSNNKYLRSLLNQAERFASTESTSTTIRFDSTQIRQRQLKDSPLHRDFVLTKIFCPHGKVYRLVATENGLDAIACSRCA